MRLLKIFLPVVVLVAVVQSPALAKSVKCTFINETEQTINELYITPVDKTGWGKNLLSTPLNFHDTTTFKYSTKKNLYNVKVVFASGEEFAAAKVDLSGAEHIDIYFDVADENYRISKNSVG